MSSIPYHLLAGNKAREGGAPPAVTLTEGANLAAALGTPFVETSAKDDVNVTLLFEALSKWDIFIVELIF